GQKIEDRGWRMEVGRSKDGGWRMEGSRLFSPPRLRGAQSNRHTPRAWIFVVWTLVHTKYCGVGGTKVPPTDHGCHQCMSNFTASPGSLHSDAGHSGARRGACRASVSAATRRASGKPEG